jgi:hypothetical protein
MQCGGRRASLTTSNARFRCRQDERHGAKRSEIVEAASQFASGVGAVHGGVGQPEAAAGQIGLAISRRVKILGDV